MNRVINFKNTVFEICRKNPEVIDILRNMGFVSITNPSMMNTAGRIMTIPKGAAMRGMELSVIKNMFTKQGYGIVD